jgi:hypothetical protein
MTWWRPLWYLPNAEALRAGSEAASKAAELGGKSDRERGFISALASFYRDSDKVDYRTRALAYEDAMEKLYQKYPNDHEIAAFYGLSLLDTAFPPDANFTRQRKAAVMLEKVFTEQPDHPGAAHYIIHSFDFPALAPEALKASRDYSKIAPSVPHAQHMPSHIFTRLGLWQDSINSNLASRDAAVKFAAATHMSAAWDQQLHAMDYLMYAYLQQGRDQEAERVAAELAGLKTVQPTIVSFYAEAAIPARYAVERGEWAAAASLQPVAGAGPETRAITHWARALGAAHTGNLEAARSDLSKLQELHDQLAQIHQGYDWSAQAEIQRREAAAWIAHAEGLDETALRLMRSAVELEESTDKHPVTPGPVLPARELMGDLLSELHQPKEALQEYQASLRTSPQRFHGLYRAARSAQAAGVSDTAAMYFQQLVSVAAPDAERKELQEARTYLAKKQVSQR